MTIIFFGSDPWFSPPVLEALLKAGHEMLAIVTRGEIKNEFSKLIELNKLKTLVIDTKTPEDISLGRLQTIHHEIATPRHHGARNDNSLSSIIHQPSTIVLAAFGPPFLPAEVLSWPKYGCLNVHASLLPRWRGASPVFGAIANGDKETGVSIMKMTEEIDLGPVLRQKSATILQGCDPSYDNRETLTRRLGTLGGKLIVETLKKLENGQVKEVKQSAESPTPYTHRLTKGLGKIDWKKSPVEIERFIRAVTPWPGAVASARFKIQDSRFMIQDLKILKAHLEESSQQQGCHAPTSVGTRNDVALIIDEIQLPGKNPISWKAFLAGHPNAELE